MRCAGGQHHDITLKRPPILKHYATLFYAAHLTIGLNEDTDFVQSSRHAPNQASPAFAHDGKALFLQGSIAGIKAKHARAGQQSSGLSHFRSCFCLTQFPAKLSREANVVSRAQRPDVDGVKAVQTRRGEDEWEAADLLDDLHQRATTMKQMQSVSKRCAFNRLRGTTPSEAVRSVQHDDMMAGGYGVKGRGQASDACAHHRYTYHDPRRRWISKGLGGCFQEVVRTPYIMPDAPLLPHDRGHELWTMEDGPSRKLMASIDRWVGAMVGDDGIDMPLSGSGPSIEATVFARQDGLVVGCAVVDYLLQIWAPSVRVSWFAGDGKRVSSGDEIAVFSGARDDVLAIERIALNALGQLSGIASETKRWSAIAPKQIACTRKTSGACLTSGRSTWGGLTHRLSKDDAVMIKENDLASMHEDLETHVERLVTYLQSVDMASVGAFLKSKQEPTKKP